MINRLQLLKNVGQFEAATLSSNESFNRLTLIYGENGRGKTTVAAVLTSLMTGDGSLIVERHRLGATEPPHIVVNSGSNSTVQFQNGAWTGTNFPMVVFDDAFVDANVCSGLAVATSHRQKLHELILGSQGVTLNTDLQGHVAQIEAHNTELKKLAAAIPASVLGGMTVDQFCKLTVPSDIDESLAAAERNLAALQQSEAIRTTSGFPSLTLPEIDTEAIRQLLEKDVAQLSGETVTAVQEHFQRIGSGGENWVSAGVPRAVAANETEACPFCGQDLLGSHLYQHFGEYFGEAYKALKAEVTTYAGQFNHDHSEDTPAAFERMVRVVVERRAFWSQFCDAPEVSIDTAEIARTWKAARDAITGLLTAKKQTPVERIDLSSGVETILAAYEQQRQAIFKINASLQGQKETIDAVKEQAGADNASVVKADLTKLRSTKERSKPEIEKACTAYLAEKTAKNATGKERDAAKVALKKYREAVFPRYETAINKYLRKFNANFRLSSVQAADTRGGPTCNYGVLVNSSSTPISVSAPADGAPSFKTALSSGDRNTLALAFFLASIDEHPKLAELVVVVDDPINSLDDHRTVATTIEVRKLLQRVGQVVVLSHSKPFLCRLWENTDNSETVAFEIKRSGNGSSIAAWDVTQDCITEHDKRHVLLENFAFNGHDNLREVACALRPHLEAYCRVAYPRWFPPGTLLGAFRGNCEQRIGTDQILSRETIEELRELTEFGNLYHHVTNPSWETESINDAELLGYTERTLAFVSRPN